MDIFDQLDAVGVFEGDVHDDQAGLARFNHFDRLVAVFGFGADAQVGFAVNDLGEPFAHQGMIVDQQNARALAQFAGQAACCGA